MKFLLTFTSAILISSSAMAAAPAFQIKDNSPANLMPAGSAQRIWTENLPAKLALQFPVKRFGYISEVNGGFDASKHCIVVARAMMVPMSGKKFIYEPKKTSVTFATQADATVEQCSALAKSKLTEAVQSVAAN
jgi:hypothetical protein